MGIMGAQLMLLTGDSHVRLCAYVICAGWLTHCFSAGKRA